MSTSQRTPQNVSPGTPKTPAPSMSAPKSRTQSLEYNTDGQPRFHGCSSIKTYEMLDKLGEGTFGEVYKARHRSEGSLFAMKKILMHNEKDGFPITALREIKLLKMLSHPNVLRLKEMVVEHTTRAGKMKSVMYMVMPYMNHDLSGLLENPKVKITEAVIKCYMLQLLKGVQYLHATRILHRDMKAANLLINHRGILQIADFGLARQYDEEPPRPGRGGGEAQREYTALVVTRWYRPPELLLSLRKYTTAIDMWGVGCILGEMFRHKPILAGSSDLKQAYMIFELVGSPTEENMPGYSSLQGCEGVREFQYRKGNIDAQFGQYSQRPEFLDLMKKFLLLDWRKRITAVDALEHPYFRVQPLPVRPDQIPQFEESHELDRRKGRESAALPPAPAGGDVGLGHNKAEWGSGHNGYDRRGAPPNGGYYNDRAYQNTREPPNVRPGERRPRDWDRRDDRRDGRDSRRPPPPPPPPNTALPAKPPPSVDASKWPAGGNLHQPLPVGRQPHGREPRGRGPPPGAANVDTYIPSYGADDRPPRYEGGGRRSMGMEGGPASLNYDGADDRRDDRRGPPRDRDRDRMRNRSRSPGRRPMEGRDRDRGGYGRR